MKGYGIEITNNLLEPKHIKAMGSAVWEYMWCLDKMTKIDEDGTGYVLGGKPVKLEELNKDLGKDQTNISTNLHKLQEAGYIDLKRTGYGNIITVCKAKKNSLRKGENAKSEKVITPDLNDENAKSIIDPSVDITVRQGRGTPPTFKSITYLKELPLEDLVQFSETYQASQKQVREKAEAVVLYCESAGKRYSNYRSTLQGWLLRDYGKRTNGGYTRV